jgi:hypothetical protein
MLLHLSGRERQEEKKRWPLCDEREDDLIEPTTAFRMTHVFPVTPQSSCDLHLVSVAPSYPR